MLTRIAAAARRPGFADELASVGIDLPANCDAPTFIALVAECVDDHVAGLSPSGHFGDIAQLALRSALAETVGQHGRSLFQSSLADLRDAVAAHATRTRFGELGHRFFADFLDRSMQAFVDRELARHIGPTRAFTTLANSREFQQVLTVHARQSARIVEVFAADWFVKHYRAQEGAITSQEAQGFVSQAVRKLCDEILLQREAA
jgi:hypothetical protein